jgi:hypothetical protein
MQSLKGGRTEGTLPVSQKGANLKKDNANCKHANTCDVDFKQHKVTSTGKYYVPTS